jgi:hypothetical protein
VKFVVLGTLHLRRGNNLTIGQPIGASGESFDFVNVDAAISVVAAIGIIPTVSEDGSGGEKSEKHENSIHRCRLRNDVSLDRHLADRDQSI